MNKSLLTFICLLLAVPCQAKIIYVDDDANGLNDGSSWQNAYKFLQDALADANSSPKPVEIRVSQGIYKPDQGAGITPGDRVATFRLINYVTLKGGYAGAGEPDPNARGIELYKTILSGDLNGDDVNVGDPCDLWNEPSRAENSYHVVTISNTDVNVVLDGFTISGGNANGPSYEKTYGGGMYNRSNSLTVNNCTFKGNTADWGGGVNTWSGSSTLTNCTFEGNWSRWFGGGMYSETGSTTLINCKFTLNVTAGDGGAWCSGIGTATAINCIFAENSADYDGGGISNGGPSVLLNCTLSRNSANHNGGGMSNLYTDSSPTLVNCIFEENSAHFGGGMRNYESDPTLISCTFARNSARESGGGILVYSRVNQKLTNCIFIANSAGKDGGGISNLYSFESSTLLTNCTFIKNLAEKGNSLACISPREDEPTTARFTNCILWDGSYEIWNNNKRSMITINYSDVLGGRSAIYDPCGMVIWGEGNIDTDPCFAEPGYWDPNGTPDDPNDDFWIDGDYHLKSQAGRWDANEGRWTKDEVTSPCIDAGDPHNPIGLEPFPNGGIINMGAYGGTIEASKSYFGEPVCETIVAGDINGDCKVDFKDFAFMAFHWLEER